MFQSQWTIILVVRFLSIDIWLHSAQPPPPNTNQTVDDTSNCLKAWRCSWLYLIVLCGVVPWPCCKVPGARHCAGVCLCFDLWCILVSKFIRGLRIELAAAPPRSKRANKQWGLKIALYVLPLGCEWNFRSKNARSGIPQIGWLETPRESPSFWA